MKQVTLPHTPSVECDHVPKVLLVGHGIDRAFGRDSWTGAIRPVWYRDLAEEQAESAQQIPPSLRPAVLLEGGAGGHAKEMAGTLASLSPSAKQAELLRGYLALPVDAVLTTCESYALEKAADPGLQCKPGRRCRARHLACLGQGKYAAQQMHTFYACGEGMPPIWHIRGEAARPESLLLDHCAYGKALARMQRYLPGLLSRHNLCKARGWDMKLYSWLDYFMLGEVHMVGMELMLAEPDLWWLMSCKHRYFPDRAVVLYQPDVKPEVRLMAESYGVTVDDDGFFGRYREYYTLLCQRLEEKLSQPGEEQADCDEGSESGGGEAGAAEVEPGGEKAGVSENEPGGEGAALDIGSS